MKGGLWVFVKEGVHKGKSGIAWHHEQRKEFNGKKLVYLENKDKPVLISNDNLTVEGFVN
jgi:hypothetical protein